jgi:predicted O-methyltransferase YrrM
MSDQFMRIILRRLIPKSIRSYLHDIQFRLTNLEMAMEVLVSSPVYEPGNDVGFNGQLIRKQIFRDLLAAFPFEVILETGTWTGNTSAFMAQTSHLPVYTCELDRRFHLLAKRRLAAVGGVHFELADSRRFLEAKAQSDLSRKFAFFYLDAHWYDDLPLSKELDIIESAWKNFVVMIDDFRVPGDTGYQFDTYSHDKTLSIKYLDDIIRTRKLAAFYPAAPSSQETGHKRGCVVITRNGDLTSRMSGIRSLRPT